MRLSLLPFLSASLMLTLAACDTALPLPRFSAPEEVSRRASAPPPGADPNSCWATQTVPGVYETVTEQIILQPTEVLADGTVLRPAIYKTETRQAVVRERKETWFEIVCDDHMSVDFVASLQRALKARGHYRGTVTAGMNAKTREAIRRYQKSEGLDANLLSVAAARKLGLIAVSRSSL